MPKENAPEVKAPTKAELKADAEALAAKIRTVPKFDQDPNLLYALREANNLTGWLSK